MLPGVPSLSWLFEVFDGDIRSQLHGFNFGKVYDSLIGINGTVEYESALGF